MKNKPAERKRRKMFAWVVFWHSRADGRDADPEPQSIGGSKKEARERFDAAFPGCRSKYMKVRRVAMTW